ncbi:MAG: MogA/MoaB family molybdenum cofactor biosynthesis protein [Nitrospinota bacterium]
MENLKVALVIVSDSLAAKKREDKSQAVVEEFLADKPADLVVVKVIADGIESVEAALAELLLIDSLDLILTTGGTGVSPRDLTPEGTSKFIKIAIPGLIEAMRNVSMKITKNAILMRGLAGFNDGRLIVNLPGSPKSLIENLSVVWDGMLHGIKKAQGDISDCIPN